LFHILNETLELEALWEFSFHSIATCDENCSNRAKATSVICGAVKKGIYQPADEGQPLSISRSALESQDHREEGRG
jgi:hypothetical protein